MLITPTNIVAPRRPPSLAPSPTSTGVAGELHGEPDGAPIALRSGVVIELRRIGNERVSTAELLAAVAGVSSLPVADQQLVAASGVRVRLLPSAALEQGADGRNLLGGTTIERDASGERWAPTGVRIAVRAGRAGRESTPEIVQHELGHVVSVLRGQDRSEQAAEAYAGRY